MLDFGGEKFNSGGLFDNLWKESGADQAYGLANQIGEKILVELAREIAILRPNV
jgi:hypothetical protein